MTTCLSLYTVTLLCTLVFMNGLVEVGMQKNSGLKKGNVLDGKAANCNMYSASARKWLL